MLLIDQERAACLALLAADLRVLVAAQALTLDAAGIVLSHPKASLEVGTAEHPFGNAATILLDGSPDPSSDGLSNLAGGLVVQAGRLELHGAPKEPTWTHLAQTASIGDTSIVLSQPVNWAVRTPASAPVFPVAAVSPTPPCIL